MLEICEIGEQGVLVALQLILRLDLMNSCTHTSYLGGVSTFMDSSYLVDPASSHMLVSKIKPCMSKYKQLCTVKLRMAH